MIWRLFLMSVRLNLRRLWYFRTSLLFDTVGSLAYALITVVFWTVIYGRVRPLPGWSLGQTFAFTAFVELSFALSMSIFIATGKAWQLIITGRIDVYLIRPVDSRLFMNLLYLRLENLIRAIPSIAMLMSLAWMNGVRFTFASIITSLTVALMGSVMYACLQMAGSWASFWIGRAQMIDEITDSVREFANYPLTIFPGWIKIVLTTIVPMAFASTQPALILTRVRPNGFSVIATALVVGVAWWLFQDFLWQRGLRRYEGYGG